MAQRKRGMASATLALRRRIEEREAELDAIRERRSKACHRIRREGALTLEAQEGLMDRLYSAGLKSQKDKEEKINQTLSKGQSGLVGQPLNPPTEGRMLTSEEQEGLSYRLFYKHLEDAEDKEATRLERLEEMNPPVPEGREDQEPLDAAALEAFAIRMHDEEREKRLEKAERLSSKYLPEIQHRTITPESLKACADRLHDESMTNKRQQLQQLGEKYLAQPPKTCTLRADELSAMANRLANRA